MNLKQVRISKTRIRISRGTNLLGPVKLGPEWCNAEPFRPQKFGAGKVGTARPERLGPGRQAISVSAILPLAHRLQKLEESHWARRKVLPSWLKT